MSFTQYPSPIAEGTSPGKGPADTRCAILKMAERLFREIGYRKTTVADIAKSLRMSPANVYRFFGSKKAINEAVADRMIDELDSSLERIADQPSVPASQRLRAVLTTMNRMSIELFTADRRMHDMVEAAMSESWQVVHRHILRTEAVVERLIREGIAEGEFAAPDPVAAARCTQSAMIRFCHPTIIVQCAEEPALAIEAMCDFILASLRAS